METQKVRVTNNISITLMVWIWGLMFSYGIGAIKFAGFSSIIMAIAYWPYYLGIYFKK